MVCTECSTSYKKDKLFEANLDLLLENTQIDFWLVTKS